MHLAEPVLRDDAPDVLLVGWPIVVADALIAELRVRGVPAHKVSAALLPDLAAQGDAVVVALGPEADPKLVTASCDQWVIVPLAVGDDLHAHQSLADINRLFFSSRKPPPMRDTVELLHAAWKHIRKRIEPTDDQGEGEAKGRVLDLLRRLARAADLPSALRDIEREMCIVAGADHACVWIFDERSATLTAGSRRESAAAGLTSFVARTGRAVVAEELEDDPRYDAGLDNEGRGSRERFLAAPIALMADEDARVLAVLSLTRSPQAPPFSEHEYRLVGWSAQLLAPALARLLLGDELESRAAVQHTAIRPDMAQLFRTEALHEYQRGRAEEAHLLEIEPGWTRYAYRLLLALFAAALLFSLLVHVDRHVEGVGVVRDGALASVVSARHRAQVRPGMPLRFEHVEEPLAVASVGDRVIAATEARRLLGTDGASWWTSNDPAVRIGAALPAGRERYGDGVTGRVRVRIGRERLLSALIPALRGWSD